MVCIATGLAIKKIRAANARGRLHRITADQIRILPSVQITPVETTGVLLGQDSRFTSAPHPKEINCLHGMIDLSQSLVALAEKYSLNEITLATADGLLLASSHRTPSSDDIARYCGIYNENPHARFPGIMLFGVEHKGSSLVGIVKTKGQILEDLGQELTRETKDILNWWI